MDGERAYGRRPVADVAGASSGADADVANIAVQEDFGFDFCSSQPSTPTGAAASSSSEPPPISSQQHHNHHHNHNHNHNQNHNHQALPYIPTLAVTSSANYGRFDAENESSLELLTSVPDDGPLRRRFRLPTSTTTTTTFAMSPASHDSISAKACMETTQGIVPDTFLHQASVAQQQHQHRAGSRIASLLTIPPELADAILSYLSPYDLTTVASTCYALRKLALSDFHWHRCVQQNVPGLTLSTPGPCSNYRELYAAHDRLWFLPKYKLWFCDRDLTGKLIMVRYDPRRGCIEGYQLVAVSNRTTFEHWPADQEVIIHGFEPQVKLHLDKPVVQFRVQDRQEDGGFSRRPGANRFSDEIPMALESRAGGMFSNFLLTRPLDPEEADRRLATDYPYENVWPPPVIPARHHVSGARSGQAVIDLSPNDRPQCRPQISDQTFRIRQWMELPGTPAPPMLMGQAGSFAGTVQVMAGADGQADSPLGTGTVGVHIGEEIITYSTLDPVLYTPTPTKPWRGIWVGDYSGHGCEFLLINQPDDPPASDVELGLIRQEAETDVAWEQRRKEARMYRGRLEAIKLTGDPNVPRGEYTFVADDLGPDGYVGVATDAPFSGARVVQSKGHVAATGFVRDKFIESQLILISPNRLAQYWVGFGHISFFERVEIDQLLSP